MVVLLLSIIMVAGTESRGVKLRELPAKISRKRKAPKASSGLVEAPAPSSLHERESEPKDWDDVQGSQVPSRDDPASDSAEAESSMAPRVGPPKDTLQDANTRMSDLLERTTDLMGMVTARLKPNGVVTSGVPRVKVAKRLPIKIPPPKPFEGDRNYERVAAWLREAENFSGPWRSKKFKRFKWRRGC